MLATNILSVDLRTELAVLLTCAVLNDHSKLVYGRRMGEIPVIMLMMIFCFLSISFAGFPIVDTIDTEVQNNRLAISGLQLRVAVAQVYF